jgi:hypothetical protein
MRDTAKTARRWLRSDMLTQRTPAALTYQTHGELVIIGMALADDLGLPLDDVKGAERCVAAPTGYRRRRGIVRERSGSAAAGTERAFRSKMRRDG